MKKDTHRVAVKLPVDFTPVNVAMDQHRGAVISTVTSQYEGPGFREKTKKMDGCVVMCRPLQF